MKFATYNIDGGAGWSGYKVTTDYKLIAEDILESGAEVVGLQEVDMDTKRNGGKNTVGEIMAHSKWYGFFVFPKRKFFANQHFLTEKRLCLSASLWYNKK